MKAKLCLFLLALSGGAYGEDALMEVIPLENRPATEIQPLLTPLLEGNERVVDDGSNLIVKATPGRLETIKSLVKQLDTVPSNLIVTVLQNSSKTAAELNAEATIANSVPVIQMHGMNANTRDAVNYLKTEIIRTLDGHPAYVNVGKAQQMQTGAFYGNGLGLPMAGSNMQYTEVNSGFTVTPRLSGQQVTISVQPWSQRFQQGPNIASESANTTIRADLGEWVEIAGNDSGNNTTTSGFNSFNVTTNKRNFRILVKVEKAN